MKEESVAPTFPRKINNEIKFIKACECEVKEPSGQYDDVCGICGLAILTQMEIDLQDPYERK